MKLGLWLRLIWCVAAYCGCGGSEFLVGIFPDGGAQILEGAPAPLEDQEAGQDAHPVMTTDGSTPVPKYFAHHDAGDERDAADPIDSPAPAADSGSSSPPAGDAADEPSPPPPPTLCCLTPCSGSSVAAITCGNGPAWDCAAGSCSARACAVGAVCHWMGATCTGSVEVCP